MTTENTHTKGVVLTGDRPSGPLHLGHFVGSLRSRVELQETHTQYVLIADTQAFTDNDSTTIQDNIPEIVRDYLAVGIDPSKTTICLQSLIPELAEMTLYYLNLVSVARLGQNPTVKDEIKRKEFGDSVPAGFLIYPVSQAADITAFKATVVPVGEDQKPMIEQTNDIVRAFNRTYNCSVLVEAEAMITSFPRLPGLDGKTKMSKSLNNAIYLKDDMDTVREKVNKAYTDPNHIDKDTPGTVEGNVVFSYLDAFDSDTARVEDLKSRYEAGGLGDVEVKTHLTDVLHTFLQPIQERRNNISDADVRQVIAEGTEKAQAVAKQTLKEIKDAMGINYAL